MPVSKKIALKKHFLFFNMLLLLFIFISSCNTTECPPDLASTAEEYGERLVGSPVSYLRIYIRWGQYYTESCIPVACKPIEMRYFLYGKTRVPGSEETLLEQGREDSSGFGIDEFQALRSFDTPANTDFRLVYEGDTPECTRDNQGFRHEYTFSTPLLTDLTGVIYIPNEITVLDDDVVSSPVPSPPTNNYVPPLTYEIAEIDVFVSEIADHISINSSTGVISGTDLETFAVTNRTEYGIDVSVLVTDGLGKTGTFEDAFSFEIRFADQLPSNLVYNPNTITQTSPTASVSSVVPTVSGDAPFTYSFANSSVPSSAISIDADTGKITATNILALEFGNGTYVVDVIVTNAAGSVTFPAAYTIVVSL